MPYLLLCLSLLFLAAQGLLLATLILRRESIPAPAKLALAYGLGALAVTVTMMLFILLDRPLTLAWLVGVLALADLSAVALCLKNGWPIFEPRALADELRGVGRLSRLEQLLLALLGFKLVFVFTENWLKPVFGWDAVALHSVRAKALLLASGPFYPLFKLPPLSTEYPLHRVLLETWVMKWLTTFNELLPKMVFSLYFLSLLAIAYYALRRFVPRYWALFSTYLLASVPLLLYHSVVEYCDLELAYYASLGLIFLFLWLQQKEQKHWLVFSALCVGAAPHIKTEGLPLTLLACFVLFIFLAADRRAALRPRLVAFGAYAGLALVPFLPWTIFKYLVNFSSNWGANPLLPVSAMPGKSLAFLSEFWTSLIWLGNWNLLFPLLAGAFGFFLIFDRKKLMSLPYLYFLAVISSFFVYMFFIFSATTGSAMMGVALTRVFLPVVPFSAFCLGIFSYDLVIVEGKKVLANLSARPAGGKREASRKRRSAKR